MTKKKLIHDLKRKFSVLQKSPKPIAGVLGDGFSRVSVSGRPNYVYFRATGYPVTEVYNDRVAIKNNLPVLCGYDPLQPDLFQVLSVRTTQPNYPVANQSTYGVPNHARTHEWMAINGGNDTTFAHLRQLMPLRPTIIGALSVHYYRNITRINDNWLYVSGTTVDYEDVIPITGARFLLAYVNTDGGILHITGTTKGDITLLTLDDIPDPIPGTVPIAAVRLYGWQTGIVETRTNTDLIDLRWNAFDTSLNSSKYLTGVSHNALPDLQGGQAGQYYHLNAEKYNDVISGSFPHNSLEGLQGGQANEYYHLTLAQLNEKIISGSTGGGGHTIEDDGTPLTQRTNLDFVGPMFVVYDDAGNDATIMSGVILGGGSSGGGTSDFLGMTFYEEGAIVTGVQLGESVVASVTGTLSKVVAYLDYAGLTGTTTIDVHKNGVTIFTDPADKPVISFSGSVAEGVPDVLTFNPNDVFTLYVDGVATSADTLGVLLVKTASSSGGVSAHNDLTGIQGGAVGDYYHLTQAEVISALSGTSSGDVATDSIWDAKGDLAVGSGANAASRLGMGANGQVPVYTTGTSLGITPAYPMPLIRTAYTSSADNHGANNTWEFISGTTVTVTPPIENSVLLCTFTCRIKMNSAAGWEYFGLRFILDDTTVGETYLQSIDVNAVTTRHWIPTIHTVFSNVTGTGAHTVKAQWWDSNSGQDVTITNRRLTVMVGQ